MIYLRGRLASSRFPRDGLVGIRTVSRVAEEDVVEHEDVAALGLRGVRRGDETLVFLFFCILSLKKTKKKKHEKNEKKRKDGHISQIDEQSIYLSIYLSGEPETRFAKCDT